MSEFVSLLPMEIKIEDRLSKFFLSANFRPAETVFTGRSRFFYFQIKKKHCPKTANTHNSARDPDVSADGLIDVV
jgi:hypothetical protein